MYIRNINWKNYHLETSFAFENKKYLLETYELDWKHILYIGNISWCFQMHCFQYIILCFQNQIYVSN